LEEGKVFFIEGNKSTYNGNEDTILRILPKVVVPFEELTQRLTGKLIVTIREFELKAGILKKMTPFIKEQGAVTLEVIVYVSSGDRYHIQAGYPIAIKSEFISFLANSRIDHFMERRNVQSQES
ncbi:MAG TPA: hypothetical protein GXX77_04600, partial [Candidatus Cloacimonetes bacterium]|nr:hypothetical protein [Candidatus Cloacimonadota bacterium]